MRGYFCSHEIRVDGRFVAMNEVFVKCVFDIRAAVLAVEEVDVICFVFGEEQAGIVRAEEPALAVLPVLEFDA